MGSKGNAVCVIVVIAVVIIAVSMSMKVCCLIFVHEQMKLVDYEEPECSACTLG